MTDIEISAAAAWFRQREGETDEAWLERLFTTLAPQPAQRVRDENADRIGERVWKRFVARHEAGRSAR